MSAAFHLPEGFRKYWAAIGRIYTMTKKTKAPKTEAKEETKTILSHWAMLVFIFFVFFLYIFLCEAGL